MMNDANIHIVNKVEHHWVKTCPCDACKEQRKRMTTASPPPHVKSMSVESAHLLGFLRRRSPHGSLARELMKKN